MKDEMGIYADQGLCPQLFKKKTTFLSSLVTILYLQKRVTSIKELFEGTLAEIANSVIARQLLRQYLEKAEKCKEVERFQLPNQPFAHPGDAMGGFYSSADLTLLGAGTKKMLTAPQRRMESRRLYTVLNSPLMQMPGWPSPSTVKQQRS